MALRWQLARLEELSSPELYVLLALRQQVFVVEQACAYLDADGLDEGAVHLLAWEDGRLVAALRVLAPGVVHRHVAMGRVVVAPSHRGRQLGRAIMERGLAVVRAVHGSVWVHLSAQAHLVAFYGSLGFVARGEGYLEDGIPHVGMERSPAIGWPPGVAGSSA